MKYVLLSSLMLCATADAETYKSIANEIIIDDQNKISISMLKMDSKDEIDCLEDGVTFDLQEPFSEVWLDSMFLSRQSQQLLEFNYDSSDCQLTSIKMLPIFTSGDGGIVGAGPLEETGLNGNVALIGTNGITSDSISSGEYYNRDEPAAAFDGYVYSQQVNEDSEGKIARGIWLTKQWDDADQRVAPWIQMDFGTVVKLSGVGVFLNAQSLGLGRLPRYLSLYTSDNGQEFEKVYETTLQNQEGNSIQFPSSIEGRFFKLEFNYNFGDGNYIEVDEIEFYQ